MYQSPLPQEYLTQSADDLSGRIGRTKDRLGGRLVILGHHYQRDEIIGFSDYTGDSLKLSQLAAQQKQAEFIVFCGVHFMAESADILSSPWQKVLLPDLTAGCPMADMADIDQVESGWRQLGEILPKGTRIMPVCYVNSTAEIKAFCGRYEGLCCTSGNSMAVFKHVWEQDPRAVIFFLPDEHLGRNTAYEMNVPLEEMAVWDPYQRPESRSRPALQNSRIILWKGFCSVHMQFTVEQIEKARREKPGIQIMVHPECRFEVARSADTTGSTERIIQVLQQGASGSRWAVGTEVHLVERLARELAEKDIHVQLLGDQPGICNTMSRIDLGHLAWTLESICQWIDDPGGGEPANQIVVPSPVREQAGLALERMLRIKNTSEA